MFRETVIWRWGTRRMLIMRFFLFVFSFLVCCENLLALDIINHYSPRNRERPRRRGTYYIILHTTEGPKKGSLSKVHDRGEAHYFIDTKGRTYRIIDKRRVALHAGRSMWHGRTNIDNYSIGIEMVGYHNRDITSAQYRALKKLLAELKKMYRIPDDRVLTHSMVAYGAPNRWHRRSHRGRKRCGMLFAHRSVRRKLGIHSKPEYDPDVKKGRLVVADKYLARVLYGDAGDEHIRTGVTAANANIITRGRSAWDIARDKYNSPNTLYILPDGRNLRGNQIGQWKKIPPGTKVVTGTGQRDNEIEAVKEIGVDGRTAMSIAGDEFDKETTVYFLTDKTIRKGNELDKVKLASLPVKTRLLVGYAHGGYITAKKSAFDLCGKRWNFPSTFYRFPNGKILSGNIVDENRIPKNTAVFFRN